MKLFLDKYEKLLQNGKYEESADNSIKENARQNLSDELLVLNKKFIGVFLLSNFLTI